MGQGRFGFVMKWDAPPSWFVLTEGMGDVLSGIDWDARTAERLSHPDITMRYLLEFHVINTNYVTMHVYDIKTKECRCLEKFSLASNLACYTRASGLVFITIILFLKAFLTFFNLYLP